MSEPVPWLLSQDTFLEPYTAIGRNASCRTLDIWQLCPEVLGECEAPFSCQDWTQPHLPLGHKHAHGLRAVLKLLHAPWCEGAMGGLPAKSQPWSHGRDMTEVFKSSQGCVGRRPVGSRECENIIPLPSVNLHLSLKNVSPNREHSLAESSLAAKLQPPPHLQQGHHRVKIRPPWGCRRSLTTPLTELEVWSQQPLLNPLCSISALWLKNSHFQALLGENIPTQAP